MSVVLTIEGLDSITTMLDPGRFQQGLGKAVSDAASMLRDASKLMPPVSAKTTGYAALGIPVDTSRMRDAIRSQQDGPLQYEVIADTDYSGYVDEGTSRMPARPFFQWLLDDFEGRANFERIIISAIDNLLSHR